VPLVRYLKPLGPYSVGEVREATDYEAEQLVTHGVAVIEGDRPQVRHATAKPANKRTAHIAHDEG